MPARGPDPAGEAGYALVAALVGAMLFALFAYAVLAADRGASAGLSAQLTRARLEAAADAGLATAISNLGASEGSRWPVDGRAHSLSIDDVDLAITVEDERGKVPLNRLKPDQAHRLLQAVGVPGAQVNPLTDSILNWMDGAERPNGAKILDYAGDGVRQRSGPIRTLGELAAIKGVTPELLDRIAPALTVFPDDSGTFDPRTASPLAIKAMVENGADTPDAIIRAREQAGQQTKLDAGAATSYVGRTFMVHVAARTGGSGLFERATIVELTGQPSHPFWVRAIGDGGAP